MTETQSLAGSATALRVLGPDQTDLLHEVDRTITRWAVTAGAREISPPPIYPIDDLKKFDVYKNFPHLALVACPLDLTEGKAFPIEGRLDRTDIQSPAFGLPHAACYGAYLYFEGCRVSSDTVVTLINRCFRNENEYEGLRRLLSFQMREVVAIGSFDHTQELISDFTDKINSFARSLALDVEKVEASDPFFEQDGGRSLLQKLSPVKYEFQVGGLAISSVNTHRNFFGERCAIGVDGSDEYAFSSCVAFGLERWLAVLDDAYAGDLRSALDAVRAAS